MTRLAAIPGYTTLEADSQEVKNCIEVALRCTLQDRNKRPNIGDIGEQLNQSGKHINDSAVWTEEVCTLMARRASSHAKLEKRTCFNYVLVFETET